VESKTLPLDQWAMARTRKLLADCMAAYEVYEFHRVYQNVHNFCVVDMSAFYLDVLKDRLYCSPPTSHERRSAQTVLYFIAQTLAQLLAPLITHTAEEVWQALPGDNKAESVLLSQLPDDPFSVHDAAMLERWEPVLAVRETVNKALEQARALGLLGEHIFGTDFSFDVTIKEGAGAFVCGEETALMASIEGKRGMPRPRPPFPAQKGLWGQPTNINNVETLNNIPPIILNGAEWFAAVGTKKSKGTKTFALTGKVVNSSLIEVPFGMTLREVIFGVGGGIANGRQFKAAQTGGPSGGCLSSEHLDWPIDYETLTKAGSIMGSGGLVVMDDSTCMVDVARFFLNFTQSESCGKCIPCRLGTKRMLEILERIVAGQGKMEDIDLLLELGETVKLGSLCGLGQTAPNPVLSTIRYFRDEYEAHIKEHRCPAKVCKALITYRISEEKCTGCTLCARNCPVGAISGERKKVHVIDPAVCTRCDTCRQVCNFDAVLVE
ncbi:MAG: NADH-ubiquinone oxidoreductase-F iron-sulfur binding region domain-containing protein, partial [Anaerolineae bacterium]